MTDEASALQQEAQMHFELAGAHMARGCVTEAAMSLRRSLELDASAGSFVLDAYHEVADALFSANLYSEAEACWRHSLAVCPENLGVKERLAAALRASGRLADAASVLHALLWELSGNPEEQSWVYVDLGGLIDQLVPLKGAGPEWVEPSTLAPSRFVTLGDAEEDLSAEICFRRAIALDPQNGEAHKRLADVLVLMKGASVAQKEFKIAARLLPHDICCATHAHYYEVADPSAGRRDLPPIPLATDGGGEGVEHSTALGSDGLPALTVAFEGEGWADRAASTFEKHGVVVLPSLLDAAQCQTLRAAVHRLCDDDNTLDFTSETRDAARRVHKALPLQGDTRESLHGALATLWPLLSRILQVWPIASERRLHPQI